MKKKMYLITSDFPYGKGESSFIMPELPYLMNKFEITIISNSLSTEQTDFLDNDIRIVHYERKATVLQKIWDSICYFGCKDAYFEIWDILRSRKNIFRCFFESILFFEEARRFERFLKENVIINKDEPAIIYNYWFTYYGLTTVHLFGDNPNIKVMTRAHRYDLYDEGYLGGRQPFKKLMDKKMDCIVFIAEHGRQYYLNKYCGGIWTEKYQLFRLGVNPCGNRRNKINSRFDTFLLVSCSLIIPRKRVELIIDALAQITDLKIRWVHFGDGEDYEKTVRYAKEKLEDRDNISYEFMGYMGTEQIMDFYVDNVVSAFITTTESEGCPVSVQEAMAYGIPIIGTEVAEIPYMINGNGVVLSSDPKPEEVGRAIRYIYGLSVEETARMRERSFQMWKENFNGAMNAEKFTDFLTHM